MATPKVTTTLNVDEILGELAEVATLIAKGEFFKAEGHEDVSLALREVQEFVNMTMTERDKLAELVGIPRIVGKRGRKAANETGEITPDSILANFRKGRK